ncbi:MAG: hypothetical protein HZY74_09045 [Brevundimonas sp.]|nr:MAG: hypothetical protein HZY74_09045 [Brevundimonas sp.]
MRGLLLIGVAEEGNTALIPLRAWNRSADGDSRALADGPGVLRATVPAADMIRALSQVGVTARVDPEGATGTGGYLLYHVLASVPDQVLAPSVGLLLLPPGMEGQAMREAVKAAAAAMGASLAPLPRQSFG